MPEFGGLFYFRDVHGKPVQEYWHDMKFWWPHDEALIATLMAHGMTGDPKYLEWHEMLRECKRPKIHPLPIRLGPCILTRMSKPRPVPSCRLTCTDVRFVEVDFPRQLRPRLVIQFSEGLSLLLEDQAAIPLAADFITTFRKHLAAKGGRPC